METVTSAPSSETRPMGFFSRLMAVYFEPSKAFADLRAHPRWFGMVSLLALLAFIMIATMSLRVDRETYMRKGMEQNPFTRKLSEEQKQEAIARALNNPIQMYVGMVIAPFAVFISYLVLAGIFLALFSLLGAALDYKKSLAATAWSMGPPSILGMILAIILAFVKDPTSLDIDPGKNAITNLGPLTDARDHPVLYALLSSIDVFSLWTLFLLILAFFTMANGKVSRSTAAIGIVCLWAIYIAGKLGWAALFS